MSRSLTRISQYLTLLIRPLYRAFDALVLRHIIERVYPFRPAGAGDYTLFRLALAQKIAGLGGNRMVPWPVRSTSMIIHQEKITVGYNTYPGLSPGCYIQGINGIVFGSNTLVGPNVCIVSANHDLDDYNRHTTTRPIEIGSNVWIGANSVILPGVRIGDNVIIGAGSIVRSDIPSNSIAVGNPCRVVKPKPAHKGNICS